MQYWGKITDVAVVLMMGGGFWGVTLDLLISHAFDKTRNRKVAWFANQRERQVLLSITAFEMTRYLAKSGGRITEANIHITSQLMDRMGLHGVSRTAAQNAFRVGEPDNYPLHEKMRQFCSVYFGRFDLIRTFLEIQIQTAFAGGSLHPNERAVLYVIAEELGISRTQLDQFLHMIQGDAQFGGDYQQQSDGSNWQQAQRGSTLEDVCNVLGVKPTGDATIIKCVYRRLMSEHHPDKLVAKSLPLEMMEMAKQKAQEVRQTYGLVKQQKEFK